MMSFKHQWYIQILGVALKRQEAWEPFFEMVVMNNDIG
jgi:hypothetical protein